MDFSLGSILFGTFVFVILFFGSLYAILAIKVVDQGHNYTVERLGKYTRTLYPGLNTIVPFFDYVSYKVNIKEQVMDIPSQEVITKDNAIITVDGVMFYQILKASDAMYAVDNLQNALINLATTNLRTVMGSMDLDELLSRRDEINHNLLRVIDEATTPWGIKVLRVEVKDITPPEDIVRAMAKQMTAEREKRAVVLEAEGYKQSEVLKAEGEKQAAILEAEGEKEASFRAAEAREREAEADAKSTMMVSQAIARGNLHAINYFVAMRYADSLEKIGSSDSSKVVMMPLEASNMIGSIAGIAELAKDAFRSGSPDTQVASSQEEVDLSYNSSSGEHHGSTSNGTEGTTNR